MNRSRTEKWYRFLLRLLPFDFRSEFGSQMEDAFREEQAELRAQRRFGETARFWGRTVADIARTAPRQHWSAVGEDLKLALRMIRRKPGFATAAILTLALTIGATTAIFAVAKAVVFQPLPYPAPDRLVFVTNTSLNLDARAFGGPLSYPEFLDLRSELKALDALGVVMSGAPPLKGNRGERLDTMVTSAALFSVFGGRVALGRSLATTDERPGAPPVAVLSHRAWVHRFGGDPAILGRHLSRELSGRDTEVTVVGVAAPDVAFPAPLWVRDWDAWLPLDAELVDDGGYLAENRSAFVFQAFGRLARGAGLDAARKEVELFSRRHRKEYGPPGGGGIGVRLAGLQSELVGSAASSVTTLLLAVGVLLLVACVNVATLLLARASPRHHEFAIRTALGAGRLRLARQLLTESGLLCAIGGVAGVGFAFWATKGFIAISPALPRLSETRIDWPVLEFSAAIVLAATAITGVAPAVQSSKRSVIEGLKRAAGTAGRGSGWQRSLWVLLTAQLALALVLLTAGGLMVNSFIRLVRFDLGFDTASVLLIGYRRNVPPSGDWKAAGQRESNTGVVALTQEERRSAALREEIAGRLRLLPGVASVALTTNPPIGGMKFRTSFEIQGRTAPPGGQYMADVRCVSPGYFRTMGLRLRGGRVFEAGDREGAPRVAVVNETTARTFWGNGDPLGARVRLNGRWARVVGVVADVRHMGPRAEPEPEVYTVEGQAPRQWGTVLVRVAAAAGDIESRAVRQLRSIDPAIEINRIRRLDDLLSNLVAPTRFATLLLGAFAAVALVLVLVGVHGVVACLVEQKRHEIGVRMVLGATSGRVKREVVGRAMAFGAAGAALGLLGALAVASWIRTLLFGVAPTDGATLAAVAFGLLAMVAGAAYRPASRAAAVDPATCLRAE